MMCEEPPIQFEFPVQFELPVLEEPFISASEINELLSIFQQPEPVSPSSTSTSTLGTFRSIYSPEERKIRRKISNRESARRSRLRKKRHLENLHDQVNQLRKENRQLKNRLFELTRQSETVQRESDRLLLESFLLQQKLAGLTQILQHIPCSSNNFSLT